MSDYIGKRSVVLSPLLFIASIMMFIIKFYLTSENIISYYLTIFVIGVCLGGNYKNIIIVYYNIYNYIYYYRPLHLN